MSVSPLTKVILDCREAGRQARIPFLTAGCPDKKSFVRHLVELDQNGADIIEIGVPFTDPVADGPVVALASQKALAEGVDLKWIIAELKSHPVKAPLVLMSYANPLLQFAWPEGSGDIAQKGAESLGALAQAFSEIPVSGVIVPDLPLEEGEVFRKALADFNIDLIALVGPNTTLERMQKYATISKGYVYVVSVLGTTGVREGLPPEVQETLDRARQAFSLPLALGFGVREPRQLEGLVNPPDAVIFGSALINCLNNGGNCKDFMSPWV